MSNLFDPSKFTASKAKPLPVILLLDVSGSMSQVISDDFQRTGKTVFRDGKNWEIVEGGTTRIQLLNEAVRKMIVTLAREEGMGHEFLVSIITFGGQARFHLQPTAAKEVQWRDLTTEGDTPLGEALRTAKDLVEDKQKTPGRAYRPAVILVSDGQPTDEWESQLADFVTSGRSSKCDRMAMGIGAGADNHMLGKFIVGTGHTVFQADQAESIHEFFKRVTMSVTTRMKSKDPDTVPKDSDIRLDSPTIKPQAPQNDDDADEEAGYRW